MRIVFNTLEGSYALCLLANLIQLAYIESMTTLKEIGFPTFTVRLKYNSSIIIEIKLLYKNKLYSLLWHNVNNYINNKINVD